MSLASEIREQILLENEINPAITAKTKPYLVDKILLDPLNICHTHEKKRTLSKRFKFLKQIDTNLCQMSDNATGLTTGQTSTRA